MARKGNPITISSKSFVSLSEACRFYKISKHTVRQRLELGWSINESFELVQRKASKCKGKVYLITNTRNNKVYVGITTAPLQYRFNRHKSDAKNKSTTKLHTAMRKIGVEKFKIELIALTSSRINLAKLEIGYIVKYDAVKNGYNTAAGGGSSSDRHGNTIMHNGIEFLSHAALADHLNMTLSCLRYRLREGIDLSDAIGDSRITKVVFEGKTYPSMTALGKHLGLGYNDVKKRLAANAPLNASQKDLRSVYLKRVAFRGEDRTIDEIMKLTGLSRSTIQNRINKNISLDNVKGLKPASIRGKPVVYEGKTYDRGKDLAEFLNVTPSYIVYMVKNGLASYA